MTAFNAILATIGFTALTLLLAHKLLGKARHDPPADEADTYDPYLAGCSARCCRGREAVHPAPLIQPKRRNNV